MDGCSAKITRRINKGHSMADQPTSPQSIGEAIRRARLTQKKSIQDISCVTKIPEHLLNKIEDGEWETLPGVFFTRSFIKSFCNEVGLKEKNLLNQLPIHKETLVAPQKTSLTINALPKRSNNKHWPLHFLKTKVWITGITLLFGLAALTTWFLIKDRKVNFEFDGEMSAEVALDYDLIRENYPFCRLSGPANVLIMPDLTSANISFKLLQKLGGGSVLGPIMIGGEKPFQIVQMGASVTEIVNAAAIATYNSISIKKSK